MPETKGFCPTCRREQNSEIIAHHSLRNFVSGDEGGYIQNDHFILKCGGCDTVFHRRDTAFSEVWDKVDKQYWPAQSKRDRPEWFGANIIAVDRLLYKLAGSVYTALDHDLTVLAATGMRTTFDRASELLGIDPDKPFTKKLDDLVTKGKIGVTERSNLNVLVDAGSAAAHRAWEPSIKELDTMMAILEHFLYRAFVIDEQVKALKVPPRPAKNKSIP
ncbi:DUF4145 domain-containing protein [Bradyrhizobium sp. AUGA SZCCT0160]|uniref:DUF4145 domain-containing protein n=1 Tax=Bradyrhizobium sp. AUGA SZCCT0160 TaxID=2807662 RepID=UPI001BA8EDF1|nr:DUF4145 domain-containing protein [Bradyrhizobium sp. AUGA SZCCT0160]MBR1193257.1 DUF4145 domain-containing protein [Bradyrhizobium sp. AUGA SZCCT0160]